MATVNTSYRNADVYGVPAFEVLDTFVDANLLCTAEPPMLKTTRILMGDSLTFPQFAVVGLDATTKKVVWATPTVPAIGVVLHAAVSGATNTTKYAEVSLGGDYNTGIDDAGTDSPLVWDASMNTRALRNATAVGNPALRFGTRLVHTAA
jgi:hypothetical protein